MIYKQKQLITVLKNKGLKEGIDFRVVHFDNHTEVKMNKRKSMKVKSVKVKT